MQVENGFTVQPGSSTLPRGVIFAGGGTGGHVYMAVALAQELKRRDPQSRILFVGTRQGLESRLASDIGCELQTIEVGGLNRVGLRQVLRTLFQLPRSFWTSLRIVRRFSPGVAVGVGGYASGPVLLAARLSGVPCLLIEPNVYPGFTNRILARWVDRAVVAFPETARAFGSKAVVTGIPVRREFHLANRPPGDNGLFHLLVVGGSQGSRAINTLICDALPWLPRDRMSIVHQTGTADHQRVSGRYAELGAKAEVVEFIRDMPASFAQSDLLVSRAGASTVAEIIAAGMPTILIPFPQAADDHQRKNALALAEREAALLLDQLQTSARQLAEAIVQLEQDRPRLRRMADAARQLGRSDSTNRILDLIASLSRR